MKRLNLLCLVVLFLVPCPDAVAEKEALRGFTSRAASQADATLPEAVKKVQTYRIVPLHSPRWISKDEYLLSEKEADFLGELLAEFRTDFEEHTLNQNPAFKTLADQIEKERLNPQNENRLPLVFSGTGTGFIAAEENLLFTVAHIFPEQVAARKPEEKTSLNFLLFDHEGSLAYAPGGKRSAHLVYSLTPSNLELSRKRFGEDPIPFLDKYIGPNVGKEATTKLTGPLLAAIAISIRGVTLAPPIRIAEKIPPEGAQVYLWGYPEKSLNREKGHNSDGVKEYLAQGSVLPSTRIFEKRRKTPFSDHLGEMLLFHDAAVVSGFSGGPAVNEQGELVGFTDRIINEERFAYGPSVEGTKRLQKIHHALAQALPKVAVVVKEGLVSYPEIHPSLEFAVVAPGTFTMGSPVTEPGRAWNEDLHPVRITKPFLIQTAEVTQGLYESTLGGLPEDSNRGANLPVANLTWWSALFFANELSKKQGLEPVYDFSEVTFGEDAKSKAALGKLSCYGGSDKLKIHRDANGYRLPTEAEWEYAARGGNKPGVDMRARYFFGNEIEQLASFALLRDPEKAFGAQVREGLGPRPVKDPTLKTNPLNLHGIYGNVAEWVEDRFWMHYGMEENDFAALVQDPVHKTDNELQSVRGGSWISRPLEVRSAERIGQGPNYRYFYIGFRLAKNR